MVAQWRRVAMLKGLIGNGVKVPDSTRCCEFRKCESENNAIARYGEKARFSWNESEDLPFFPSI